MAVRGFVVARSNVFAETFGDGKTKGKGMSIRAKPAPMAGLVRTKPKETAGPPTTAEFPGLENEPLVALNFTVPRSFRRRFKRLALDHDMTQVELLRRAVALLERESAAARPDSNQG
jgi:hypothetical protein